MNNGREVVIISGVRTAIGDFGGALKDFAPTDLGARCVREALSRAKVAPEEVGHVVFGGVIHTETKDMYLSRVCAINGGIPKEVPAMTLNRLCGSGLQAIISAAQIVALGATPSSRPPYPQNSPAAPTSPASSATTAFLTPLSSSAPSCATNSSAK